MSLVERIKAGARRGAIEGGIRAIWDSDYAYRLDKVHKKERNNYNPFGYTFSDKACQKAYEKDMKKRGNNGFDLFDIF